VKIIATITDRDVLGTEGLSHTRPRHAARGIVINQQGLMAVMYMGKFDLYCLPGGGVEGGENVRAALKREIMEETGCSCDYVEPLAIVEENRFCHNFTQINHYFLVKTLSAPGETSLTYKETQADTHVMWFPPEKARELISAARHEQPQRRFIQARDTAILNHYFAKSDK